ncbi:MAG: hypothetical protein AAF517_24105, partial [Planctomycetota bacterium]
GVGVGFGVGRFSFLATLRECTALSLSAKHGLQLRFERRTTPLLRFGTRFAISPGASPFCGATFAWDRGFRPMGGKRMSLSRGIGIGSWVWVLYAPQGASAVSTATGS